MSSESVRVAVRVRPFNGREKERGAKAIIQMVGKTTKITHPTDPKNVKTFNFDYSYWSHDGFIESSDGELIKNSLESPYASQQQVFEELGQDVLNNALEGYNCSLFAYGQTGSGKSYSMVGYEKNKGIVPITCNELFKIIESHTDSTVKFAVSLSMLEIYNERVRDLLTKSSKSLEIRQSEKIGFYVQDLEKIPVNSYKEIERKMNQGTSNRTIAATQMNATSSRAHTVITIEFKQIMNSSTGINTKSSTINLIDLAGSERAESTGATGDRLKEGANINKSLSALGNVIGALADSAGGKLNVLVPYRDSVLTKMLKNALGGNSKTVMIAALSPADINYDETLSTLRYADRAKRIKNVAIVNENPFEKLIRDLREENERLKKMLNGELPQEIDIRNLSEFEIEKLKRELTEELRAEMRDKSELLELCDMDSRKEKVKEVEVSDVAEDKLSFEEKKHQYPFLSNLNEDPQLSGVLIYFIESEEILMGKNTEKENSKVQINGPGIQPTHLTIIFNNNDKTVTVKPHSTESIVRVNGTKITTSHTVNDSDRILLGSSNLYIFHNPLLPNGDLRSFDWVSAQIELAAAEGYKTGDQSALESQIIEILPIVNELNDISKEMNKNRVFNVLVIPELAQDLLFGEEAMPKVMVKMTNTINMNSWLWERSSAINRRYIIQEHYQRFLDGHDPSSTSQEEDPFWEPTTEIIVGHAQAFLQNLSYNFGMDHLLKVFDYKGREEGILSVKVEPCDKAGSAVDEDNVDSLIGDCKELLNKPFYFKISIIKLSLYKSRFIHGSSVKFRVFVDDETYTTDTVTDTLEPQFDYNVVIEFSSITKDHLQYFQAGWLTFCVFGNQKDVAMKELKENNLYERDASKYIKTAVDFSRQETEFRVLKMLNDVQSKKINKLKQTCIEWASKSSEEQQFDPFYRSIASLVFSHGNKFKIVANVIGKTQIALNRLSKNKNDESVKNKEVQRTNITISRKVGDKDVVSELCSTM